MRVQNGYVDNLKFVWRFYRLDRPRTKLIQKTEWNTASIKLPIRRNLLPGSNVCKHYPNVPPTRKIAKKNRVASLSYHYISFTIKNKYIRTINAVGWCRIITYITLKIVNNLHLSKIMYLQIKYLWHA